VCINYSHVKHSYLLIKYDEMVICCIFFVREIFKNVSLKVSNIDSDSHNSCLMIICIA
jgi:hypothetical protein